MKDIQDFRSLDFGSSETPVKQQEITVVVDPEVMVIDYGKAFFRECQRIKPKLVERLELTEEECAEYCVYLLAKRIECANNECKDWRKLKLLWIPAFVQYALSMVGTVIVRDIGLVIKPTMKEGIVPMGYDKALEVSEKISYFESYLSMVQDAMPRDYQGDPSVMSTAIIAGYVRAFRKVEHIADTYVSAFLGFKIKEETSMGVLYRVQYDDLDYIISAINSRRLY